MISHCRTVLLSDATHAGDPTYAGDMLRSVGTVRVPIPHPDEDGDTHLSLRYRSMSPDSYFAATAIASTSMLQSGFGSDFTWMVVRAGLCGWSLLLKNCV